MERLASLGMVEVFGEWAGNEVPSFAPAMNQLQVRLHLEGSSLQVKKGFSEKKRPGATVVGNPCTRANSLVVGQKLAVLDWIDSKIEGTFRVRNPKTFYS
jgi:hypothetical protein